MADDAYKKAFERERLARKEAERITESKSRELFALNSALKELNAELEQRILDRTAELEERDFVPKPTPAPSPNFCR